MGEIRLLGIDYFMHILTRRNSFNIILQYTSTGSYVPSVLGTYFRTPEKLRFSPAFLKWLSVMFYQLLCTWSWILNTSTRQRASDVSSKVLLVLSPVLPDGTERPAQSTVATAAQIFQQCPFSREKTKS